MLKKSLLSLAVSASLVGLTGCNISSTTDNAGAKPAIQQQHDANKDANDAARAGIVEPVFDALGRKFPIGVDLYFAAASTSDGTAHTGREGEFDESPVTNAIDHLDGGIGISTPIDIPMTGDVTAPAPGTVFLIRLANASDNALIDSLDVQDILGQGTGAIPATGQPQYGVDYRVETIGVDGGTSNVIRVVPLKPLQPKTKYLVVVTTGVTDTDATPTPIGVSEQYEDLVGTGTLFSDALQPVRDAFQAWTGLANGYFAAAVQGGQLPAMPTISLVTAFTTVSTDSVLLGMALPTGAADSFVAGATLKTIKADVRTAAAAAGTSSDFTGTWTSITDTYTAAGTTITAAQTAVSDAITASVGGGALELSMPTSRTTSFISTTVDSNAATNVGGLGLTAPGLVQQGSITLPYYLTAPTRAIADQSAAVTAAAATAVQNTDWSADTGLGGIFKAVLTSSMSAEEAAAVAIPPQDVNGTTNVNGRYPFAAKTSDVKAPLLMHLPDINDDGTVDCGSAAGTLCPVVVYVHGITGSRAHAIPLGQGLGAAVASGNSENYATIALDLPLHGIAPRTSTGIADPFLGLSFDTGTFNALATAGGASFEGLGERHFGYGTSASSVLTPLVYDDAATDSTDEAAAAEGYPTLMSNFSGAAFINLSNFMVTRDAMRQAIMDQLNLIASLGSMDFDGHAGADFDTSKVHVVGHSLGGIVAPTVVNLVNTMRGAGVLTMPAINTMSLIAPGGQLARLIENSPSLAGTNAATSPVNQDLTLNDEFGILAALKAGTDGVVAQGTSSFEAFMNVLQAHIDSVDPIAYAGGAALAAQPTLVVEMVGDGTEANPGDQTVPNSADTGNTWESANPSPLAGTDPLLAEMNITTDVPVGGTVSGTKLALKLQKGGHAAILSTSASSADDQAAQGATIQGIVSFIDGGGTDITVTTTSAIAP